MKRSTYLLVIVIAIGQIVMGYLIANIHPPLSGIFDFALDTAAPLVWGSLFGLSGALVLLAALFKKRLYDALYFAGFVFLFWGAILLISSLAKTAFTSGYPIVCMIAAFGSWNIANHVNDRVNRKDR